MYQVETCQLDIRAARFWLA